MFRSSTRYIRSRRSGTCRMCRRIRSSTRYIREQEDQEQHQVYQEQHQICQEQEQEEYYAAGAGGSGAAPGI